MGQAFPDLDGVPDKAERRAHLSKEELIEKFIATHPGEEMSKFAHWLSTHNKNYNTVDEYSARQKNWTINNSMIKEHNETAKSSGDHDAVRYAHNSWSDASHEEIMARMNYNLMSDDDVRNSIRDDFSYDRLGRNL